MIGIQPVPLSGGVNSYLDPAAVPDANITKAENVAPRERGFPGMRPSLGFVRELIPDYRPWDSSQSSNMVKYYEWARYLRPLKFMFTDTTGGIAGLFVTTDSFSVLDDNFGTTRLRTVPAGTVLFMGLPTAFCNGLDGPYCSVLGELGPTSLLNFDGIIYAFNAGTSGARIEPGSTSSLGPLVGWNYLKNQFLGEGNSGFYPEGAAVVRDRVVYWKGAQVFWSDRNDPLQVRDNVELTSGIYVTSEELENITAVSELGTSADGSPVQSVVAVWTRSRMYMLLGEPLESDQVDESGSVLGSLQINRLNVEAGCVSQATVTRTPYGTFWVGADDVWFMPFGSLPIRVGTAIRDRLMSQPAGLSWKLCADYDDNILKISIFSPNQGPNGFSPMQEQWWLDLTQGPPQSAETARWFGPQVIRTYIGLVDEGGIFAMARDLRGAGDKKLYTLQPYKMFGRPGAIDVYGMSFCAFGAVDGVDSPAPKYAPQQWVSAASHFVGDIFVPPCAPDNEIAPVFVCTTQGSSAPSTEPTWVTSGATITDGTAVFRPIYYDSASGGVLSGRQVRETSEGPRHTPITIQTKEYTLGDPVVEKLLDGMELAYLASQSTYLTYSTNPDQTTNSRVAQASTAPTFGSSALPITATRVWRRKLLTPEANRRFSAQSAIAKIVQSPGIVIVAGYNDRFNFRAPDRDDVIIPAGYYANLIAVWAAMKAAALVAVDNSHVLLSTFDRDGGPVYPLFGVKVDGYDTTTTAAVRGYPLMRMFGFTPDQRTETNTDPVAEYLYGVEEYQYTLCPDIQFSALNIRFGAFGRRAT